MNNPFSLATKSEQSVRVATWGPPKEGKTHLGLTFPGTKWYLDLDLGLDELLGKFGLIDNPVLQRIKLFVPEEPSQAEAEKLLKEVLYAWKFAYEYASPGDSVICDTLSQVWQLCQIVYVESADPKTKRFAYGPANRVMGGLLRRAAMREGVNSYWTNRQKAVFNGQGQETGFYQPNWWGETGAAANIVLHVYQDRASKQNLATVEANRFDKDTHGLILPDVDYDMIRSLAYA